MGRESLDVGEWIVIMNSNIIEEPVIISGVSTTWSLQYHVHVRWESSRPIAEHWMISMASILSNSALAETNFSGGRWQTRTLIGGPVVQLGISV